MSVQQLLDEITNSFPSTHKVREFLESSEEKKLDAAELYLRQRHDNYGLNPEDEANLEMLIDMRDESDKLEEIYEQYQQD
jgi:transcriptional/translational regulatory protein YebC/TACO1